MFSAIEQTKSDREAERLADMATGMIVDRWSGVPIERPDLPVIAAFAALRRTLASHHPE